MTARISPDRWPDVERLYLEAIERPVAERRAFLDEACASDAGLRAEVDSLLGVDTSDGAFLERPAFEITAPWRSPRANQLEPGEQLGDYRVGTLLGRGGMGEVYAARDLKLERDVALKVLYRTPTNDASVDEEARAASGLTHPNIVTVYAVGQAGDHGFIAMELVRGSTLRQRLASGPLDADTALDFAVQLGDALSAAHAAGVLHRDLKPENVMITTAGLVKVLDFGIARRPRSDAATSAGAPPGVRAGTVGYMAPEQAEGRPSDHRADQFSLAAVIHEMLTGEVPRAGRDVDDRRVPGALRSVLTRCLRVDPKDRYADTSDLARTLRDIHRARQLSAARAGMSRRRLLWLGGAAAAGLVGARSWQLAASASGVRRLAVLPFANRDADEALEYLCDGLTDVLIRRLAFVPALEVRARSAVFNFKGSRVAAADAGRELGVDAVLSGTVATRQNRLLVEATLIELPSGAAVWTDRYERDRADALALPHDLARAIIDEAIRPPLSAEDRRRVERVSTRSPLAHDLYLRGVHVLRQGGLANYVEARRLLTAAVATDPSFALAYVPLASTYTIMAIEGVERPTEAWPQSNRYTRRALEIDPELADAHAELASSWFFFDHDWAGAESAWKRAMQTPGSVEPDLYAATAVKLFALARYDDALEAAGRARALDPLTPKFAVQQGDLLWHAGRSDDSARLYEEVIARHPDSADAWLGLSAVQRAGGRIGEAIAARRRASEIAGASPDMQQALATATTEADLQRADRIGWQAVIAEATERQQQGAYVSPLDFARAWAQLGDAERAFAALDKAFEDRAPGLVFLRVDPAWSGLRADARFAAAVSLLDLPRQGAVS